MTDLDPELIGSLAARLDAGARRRLGRSLAVCILPAADCGACALEVAMIRHRLAAHGLALHDSPLGADVLLVTGALTRSLVAPVQRALLQMSQPRWVVAVGGCAIDGGPFAAGPAVAGGVDAAIPVDLAVPGCPPAPDAILVALRTLIAVNA